MLQFSISGLWSCTFEDYVHNDGGRTNIGPLFRYQPYLRTHTVVVFPSNVTFNFPTVAPSAFGIGSLGEELSIENGPIDIFPRRT